MLEAGGSRA
jgi:hypothetical protein